MKEQPPSSRMPSGWAGKQKAGWFFVGLFGGIVGILLASLANVGHPDRSTATAMAAIGFVSLFALVFAVIFIFALIVTAFAFFAGSYVASGGF